ncbi:hypothetical protein ACFSQT_32485 [Mesorhizobium calcicola]|uniref:Uncharacterized protein n=1 Tax=Mesorhizobium calcicola TaxID=1300310 RepID=A0ABW4WMB9_9HYPH
MSRSLVINFNIDQAELYGLIHRVRNFGEDVYRFLRTNGWGEIDIGEVDAATTQLIMRDIKHSKLRRVTAWVEEEMRRQHLLGEVEVR